MSACLTSLFTVELVLLHLIQTLEAAFLGALFVLQRQYLQHICLFLGLVINKNNTNTPNANIPVGL